MGVVAAHAAGAVLAAANFFDETCGWEGFKCGHGSKLKPPGRISATLSGSLK
jgi:hypothetical protein